MAIDSVMNSVTLQNLGRARRAGAIVTLQA
jgi:hypothetical protein